MSSESCGWGLLSRFTYFFSTPFISFCLGSPTCCSSSSRVMFFFFWLKVLKCWARECGLQPEHFCSPLLLSCCFFSVKFSSICSQSRYMHENITEKRTQWRQCLRIVRPRNLVFLFTSDRLNVPIIEIIGNFSVGAPISFKEIASAYANEGSVRGFLNRTPNPERKHLVIAAPSSGRRSK